MNIYAVFKVVGLLLMFFSFIMLPPGLVGVYFNESESIAFLKSGIAIFFSGFILWAPFARKKFELKTRDGFLIVFLAWATLGLFGALPFWLSETMNPSFTDSVFESFSGFTTTGSTVFTGLDSFPKCILFYRQFLHWLGGIGIIVLAIAILPLLGVGGMQLYMAEAAGPVKDDKLAPRIAQTAKYLFYTYLGLTFFCISAYWLVGMGLFDAVCHAFSTVSLGGFANYDASFAYFNSALLDMSASFFMFLAAMNMGLHFSVWQKKSISLYLKDSQFVFFSVVVFLIITITCFSLYISQQYNLFNSLRFGIFHTLSIITTTGLVSTDLSAWPSFIPVMLICASFMGGCAGSTGGGVKVIRVIILYQQFIRELKRLIHPNGVFAIKFGKSIVSDRVVQAVWGFIGAYFSIFLVMVILLMMTGLNFETAFTAVAAAINNMGIGLGDVSSNFGGISSTAKWLLSLCMLIGRIEVFTLLVLLTPMFWRK